MRKVSSGGRRMGGSGSRGISRGPSRGFRSSGGIRSSGGSRSTGRSPYTNRYRSGINRHSSNSYKRYYGNSILPWGARIAFVLILIFMLYVALKQ